MLGRPMALRHHGEAGSTLNWLNEVRNKKSITLDLRSQDAGLQAAGFRAMP